MRSENLGIKAHDLNTHVCCELGQLNDRVRVLEAFAKLDLVLLDGRNALTLLGTGSGSLAGLKYVRTTLTSIYIDKASVEAAIRQFSPDKNQLCRVVHSG